MVQSWSAYDSNHGSARLGADLRAVGQLLCGALNTAGETMFDKLVTMASTPFKPEQATSPLAPINIGSLSWI